MEKVLRVEDGKYLGVDVIDADKCMMSDGVTSVEDEITSINSDLTELMSLNALPLSSNRYNVTGTESYTITKSGVVFCYANGTADSSHTITYTRNGSSSAPLALLTGIPIAYPVRKGDVITIKGTSSYASFIYPCGCF